MNTTKIKKHLDTAYSRLCMIPVSGDAVDQMYIAKQLLRDAYKELEKTEPETEAGEDVNAG